jgi:hypothetical protein
VRIILSSGVSRKVHRYFKGKNSVILKTDVNLPKNYIQGNVFKTFAVLKAAELSL